MRQNELIFDAVQDRTNVLHVKLVVGLPLSLGQKEDDDVDLYM